MRVDVQGAQKRFDNVIALDGLDLTVEQGEFVAILGPSSAGKTTTLRAICGLEPLDAGTISIDGHNIAEADMGGFNLAMIFQSFALYPHLTAADNLAYPLRRLGLSGADIKARVGEMADLLRIGHVLDRKVPKLSGGEQQRVAIGRALARRPDLLLLDEPLTNLDAKLREEMRAEFKRMHRDLGVSMLYATPDQLEALSLADRVAILLDGKIVQVGTPDEIYAAPASVRVANLVGSPPMNVFDATATEDGLKTQFAELPIKANTAAGTSVALGVRPSDLHLNPDDALIRFEATLEISDPQGDVEILGLRTGNAAFKIKRLRVPSQQIPIGATVSVGFRADAAALFDGDTGNKL